MPTPGMPFFDRVLNEAGGKPAGRCLDQCVKVRIGMSDFTVRAILFLPYFVACCQAIRQPARQSNSRKRIGGCVPVCGAQSSTAYERAHALRFDPIYPNIRCEFSRCPVVYYFEWCAYDADIIKWQVLLTTWYGL